MIEAPYHSEQKQTHFLDSQPQQESCLLWQD